MNTIRRYQLVKGTQLVGAEHACLRDAVLAAAAYDGHGACFVRDRHGFMSFFASRQPVPDPAHYVPAPCDGFRPFSPLKNDADAEEHVAKLIIESGWLHFRHKDLDIVTLTYVDGKLAELSSNAPDDLKIRLNQHAILMPVQTKN